MPAAGPVQEAQEKIHVRSRAKHFFFCVFFERPKNGKKDAMFCFDLTAAVGEGGEAD